MGCGAPGGLSHSRVDCPSQNRSRISCRSSSTNSQPPQPDEAPELFPCPTASQTKELDRPRGGQRPQTGAWAGRGGELSYQINLTQDCRRQSHCFIKYSSSSQGARPQFLPDRHKVYRHIIPIIDNRPRLIIFSTRQNSQSESPKADYLSFALPFQ